MKVTKQKQLVKELQKLISLNGYWSKEVKHFNSKLDFSTLNLINNLARK